MALSNIPARPRIFKLPLELRHTIWELALDPRVTFVLPSLYYCENLAEFDTSGEGAIDPNIQYQLNRGYMAALDAYFNNTPRENWVVKDIPRYRNVFFKKYAKWDLQLVNRQAHEEASMILGRIAKTLKGGIRRRQILEPATPAFLKILARSTLRFDKNNYDTVLFLQTTNFSILSSVVSVLFGWNMMYDCGGFISRNLWCLGDDRIDEIGKLRPMARLLKSRLVSLREVAICAPNEGAWMPDIYLGSNEEKYFSFNLLEDLCGLLEEGTINLLQILFKHDIEPSEDPLKVDETLISFFDEFQLSGNSISLKLAQDDDGIRLAERKWATKGIQAVASLRRR
jgi:hypothetical protein